MQFKSTVVTSKTTGPADAVTNEKYETDKGAIYVAIARVLDQSHEQHMRYQAKVEKTLACMHKKQHTLFLLSLGLIILALASMVSMAVLLVL